MLLQILLFILEILAYTNGFPKKTINDVNISVINRHLILDTNGKFHVQWEANLETKRIFFIVTAETLGYVGFGISPNGGMDGADMLIGGVHPNGFSYITDRFGVGSGEPKVDNEQNWELHEASENGTHTVLKIARNFDTCDKEDLQIESGTSNLIWAMGETDDIKHHGSSRGTSLALLLDPPTEQVLGDDVEVWQMNTELKMPANGTTYWCSVKELPTLASKRHIVGFEPYLPTAAALNHIHHFIVRECEHPDGHDLSPLLGPLVKTPGKTCYRESNSLVATDGSQYCNSYLFVWAIGGKAIFFPKNVGFPIETKVGTNKYYMLEIHLNNPEKLSDVKINTGVNIYYTSKLREKETSTLIIGHEVSVSQTIPPKTKAFVTVGHCSAECTAATLPKAGINVFSVLLHSHNAGRKVKLRHFRNNTELPWVSFDDHYNVNFQQNRILQKEIQVLPGDQFSYECTYDTSKRSSVTIGGYSSEQEMCQTVLMFYPRVDLHMCSSTFPRDEILQHFGIEKVTLRPNTVDPIVSLPPTFRGKYYTEVLNELRWTAQKVSDLQSKVRYSNHRGVCSSRPSNDLRKSNADIPLMWYIENVTYVDVLEEYSPAQPSCAGTQHVNSEFLF